MSQDIICVSQAGDECLQVLDPGGPFVPALSRSQGFILQSTAMRVATPVFAGLIAIEWIGIVMTSSSSVPYVWTSSESESLELKNGANGAATTTTTTTVPDSINPISPPPAILLEYVITVPASIITYTTMTYAPIVPSDISETPVTDVQSQESCGLTPSGSDTGTSSSPLLTQQPENPATPSPVMQSAGSSSVSLNPPLLTPPYPIPPSFSLVSAGSSSVLLKSPLLTPPYPIPSSLSLVSAVSGSGPKFRMNNSLGPSAVGPSFVTQPAAPPAITVPTSTAYPLVTEVVVVVDAEDNPISTAYAQL